MCCVYNVYIQCTYMYTYVHVYTCICLQLYNYVCIYLVLLAILRVPSQIYIQWNPPIKDTIRDLHFVLYRGVSLTEGLCIIGIIDHQCYLCMYQNHIKHIMVWDYNSDTEILRNTSRWMTR